MVVNKVSLYYTNLIINDIVRGKGKHVKDVASKEIESMETTGLQGNGK